MDLKSAIKALSKEARADLARSIRQNPDLYNAVCGVGGISESLNIGVIHGTITDKTFPIKDLNVEAINQSGKLFTAKTNEAGYYKMDLIAGDYTIKVTYGGASQSINVKIIKGETATFSHNFE
jgi:hypothetical protein